MQRAFGELLLQELGTAVELPLLVEEFVYSFDDQYRGSVCLFFDGCDDCLESVVDFAFVLGVARQCRKVYFVGSGSLKELGDLTRCQSCGECSYEGCLAYACLACDEQIRLVAASQGFVDDLKFVVEAYDCAYLAFLHLAYLVDAVLVDIACSSLGGGTQSRHECRLGCVFACSHLVAYLLS